MPTPSLILDQFVCEFMGKPWRGCCPVSGRQTDSQRWWVAGCLSEPIMFNEMRSDQSPWKLPDDTGSLYVVWIYPECCSEQHYILGGDAKHVTGNTDDILSVDYCSNCSPTFFVFLDK